MKKSTIVLAAAATIAFAGSANAQVCAGLPTLDGQFSVGGVAYFPENETAFGAEASYNAAGPLAVFGSFVHSSIDDTDFSGNQFEVGAAFDVTGLIGPQPALVSLCPVASFQYATFNDDFKQFLEVDDFSVMTVPVGLGFGANFPVSPAASVQPFAIPQIVFMKIDAGDEGSSDWENDFGLRGGANVVFGQFYVGGEVNKLFVDGSDAEFGVRAGIRI